MSDKARVLDILAAARREISVQHGPEVDRAWAEWAVIQAFYPRANVAGRAVGEEGVALVHNWRDHVDAYARFVIGDWPVDEFQQRRVWYMQERRAMLLDAVLAQHFTGEYAVEFAATLEAFIDGFSVEVPAPEAV